MSKKMAPVRRTARNTSDKASIQARVLPATVSSLSCATPRLWTIGNIARTRGHSRRPLRALQSQVFEARPILQGDEKSFMPLFIDIHNHIEGLTAEAVPQAHAADLQTQKKYDQAHGLVADDLTQVTEGR